MKPATRYSEAFQAGFEAFRRGDFSLDDIEALDVSDAAQAGFAGGWWEGELQRRESLAYDQGADVAESGEQIPCPYDGWEWERLREAWILGWTEIAVIYAYRITEMH